MFEVPELGDICQGELHTGSGTSPRQRCVVGSKLEAERHLSPVEWKSQTSDMKLQDLVLALLVWGLLWSGIPQPPSTCPLGVAVCILGHSMLEVYKFAF